MTDHGLKSHFDSVLLSGSVPPGVLSPRKLSFRRCRFSAIYSIMGLMFSFMAIKDTAGQENPVATVGGKYGIEVDLEGEANPSGLDVSMGAWYRYIYHSDNSPLWNGLYVKGGGELSFNPAYGQVGIYLEWMPISILQMRVQFDRFSFFGRDGSLLTFDNGDEPFGDADIRKRSGQEITGQADRLMFQPTLMGELGRYVLENETTFALYSFDQTGPYFWDQEYDTLLKKDDRLIANNISVLYDFVPKEQNEKFLVGPTFEVVHAFSADLTRERLGLSIYFEPVTRRSIFGYVQHPRFYLQTGINIKDRNREDQFFLLGDIGTDFDLN